MPERKSGADREAYNEYFRQYREKNREKMRAYQREYNKKWRKKHGYPSEKAYAKRNPHKRKSHYAVAYALSKGRLVKQPCEVCEDPCSQGHHDDYNKPLDVRWLCPVHHTELHRKKLAQTELALAA